MASLLLVECDDRFTTEEGWTTMVKVLWQVIFAIAALGGLWMVGPSAAASGEPSQVRQDRIAHVERVLTHAAKRSPRWHSHQASIQRDVHDIGYLVERAMKTPDPAVMQQYAREALALLRRALGRGHFHPADVAHVLTEIEQLIPDLSL
jgi:hypothetical protein